LTSNRFLLYAQRPPLDLHSFPTRRSSDLQAPAALREATKDLSPQQLDTPYREGGWTLRQVAHHVPDSHMNAYVRFKLALTEDEPDRKSTRLNSSHLVISYAVFCLKKKKKN